jgi:hypothetical protein
MQAKAVMSDEDDWDFAGDDGLLDLIILIYLVELTSNWK